MLDSADEIEPHAPELSYCFTAQDTIAHEFTLALHSLSTGGSCKAAFSRSKRFAAFSALRSDC